MSSIGSGIKSSWGIQVWGELEEVSDESADVDIFEKGYFGESRSSILVE